MSENASADSRLRPEPSQAESPRREEPASVFTPRKDLSNPETALSNPETLEQWVEQGQGLVRSLAHNIHRGLPRQVAVEDLIGYGQIGLVQAAKAYRSDYQTSFPTFAYHRIRGAILDGVGKMAWVNRGEQRRFQAERAAHELLGDPTDATKDSPSDPIRSAGWLVRATEKLAVVNLLSHEQDEGGPGEVRVEDKSGGPDDRVATDELRSILHSMVQKLPEVERSLITMTYYEGQSLAEAARALGHSKSWASRLHSAILQRLAHAMKALDPT